MRCRKLAIQRYRLSQNISGISFCPSVVTTRRPSRMKLLLLKMKFLWLCIQRKQYVYIFVNFLAFVDRFGKSVTFCLNIWNGDAILRKCVLASHSVQVYLLPVMVYQVLMEMNSYPYCSVLSFRNCSAYD